MRRAMIGLAVAMLAALALAAPASAAPALGETSTDFGFADATWSANSATGFTETVIQVSGGGNNFLLVERTTVTQDENGNMIGTQTSVRAPSGFTFTIDAVKLATANLSADGLPATTCNFDSNGQQIGDCTTAPITLNVTWTGEGLVSRAVSSSHFTGHGIKIFIHENSTQRTSTATGTLDGSQLRADELRSADLGNTHHVEVKSAH